MPLLSDSGLGGLICDSPLIAQALDPDAQSYFTAMDDAGESYWPSEVTLIDNLVKFLKFDEVWGRLSLLWFPVGGSLSGAMRALKHPLGVGHKMQNNGFTSAQWDRQIGLDARVVNGFIGTNSLRSQLTGSEDSHLSVFVEASIRSDEYYFDIGSTNSDWALSANFFGYISSRVGNYTGANWGQYLPSPEPAIGHVVASLGDSASLYYNGTKVYSHAPADRPGGSVVDQEGLIFTINGYGRSSKQLSAASAGLSLSDNQVASLNTALQIAKTQRSSLIPPPLWTPESLAPDFWGDTSDPSSLTINANGEIAEWRSRYGAETAEPFPGSASAYKGSATDPVTNRGGIPAVVGAIDRKICINLPTTRQLENSWFAAVYISHNLQGQLFDARLIANGQPLIDAGDGGGRSLRIRSDSAGLKTSATSNLGVNSWAIGVWSINGAGTSTFYQNGVVVGSVDSVTGLSSNRISLLGNGIDNANPSMAGAIAEFIFGIGPLTESDRKKIEGYLANKWALTTSLPNDHPYNPSPPYA